MDQVEDQNEEEKAQRQAELAQIESVPYSTAQVHTFQKSYQLAQGEVHFQLKVQVRETKRRKVQDERKESGVGFSVEQLKNNRGLLASTLPSEERTWSPNSVNSAHPEYIDHLAAKVLTTFHHPVTNALQKVVG